MKITNNRLWRLVDMLKVIDISAGGEADNVRSWLARHRNPLSIDTIQRDLNHLCNIGLLSRSRCCGDPYWFALTDMGRRVMAGFTRQEE